MINRFLNSKNLTFLIALTIALATGIGLTSFHSSHKMQPDAVKRDTIANWRALLSGGHRFGPADAPVQMIEFSDFQCPYCREEEPVLKSLLKKFPGKIAITRYNFPLHQHPQAMPAAIAAECAALQGKYNTYHDLLFNNQDKFENLPWDSLAKVAGISDMKSFHGCVANETTKARVLADRRLGDSLKVNWTPTLIVNGAVYPGVTSAFTLNEKVEAILSK